MAGKDTGKTQETEAERAFAEVAQQRIADYKQRWAPLIDRAKQLTTDMGKEGSVARQQAAGATNLANQDQFARANEQVDTANRNSGIRASSARAKLGTTELADSQAMSAGIGAMQADQAVDDAYTQGLAQIAALGRGQALQAVSGMGAAAGMAGQQASFDAERAANRRAGNAQLAGTVAGAGIGAAGRYFSAPPAQNTSLAVTDRSGINMPFPRP
jgi:hypothetical protein